MARPEDPVARHRLLPAAPNLLLLVVPVAPRLLLPAAHRQVDGTVGGTVGGMATVGTTVGKLRAGVGVAQVSVGTERFG